MARRPNAFVPSKHSGHPPTGASQRLATFFLAFLTVVGCSVLAVHAVWAQLPAEYEAENFDDSWDMGGQPVFPQPCSGASEGWAVDGMDLDGEWIEWQPWITEPVCFADSLLTQGLLGQTRTFVLIIQDLDTSEEVARDTLISPPGQGIGCDPEWFGWSASSRVICLQPAYYRFRLVRLGTGATRVDLLRFSETVVPVETMTWGRIKVLHR